MMRMVSVDMSAGYLWIVTTAMECTPHADALRGEVTGNIPFLRKESDTAVIMSPSFGRKTFATGFSQENRLPPCQPFTSRYFQEPLKRLNRETSCSWKGSAPTK